MNDKIYTPFHICLVVFSAILIANIFQLLSLSEQQSMLKAARANVAEAATKVKNAQTKVEALAKDLISLAETNRNAAKVVEEFKIQVVGKPEEE